MRKQIDFLDRLFKTLECRVDILKFLKEEKLITDDLMQSMLHDQHHTHSTKIAMLLHELSQEEDKIQLLSYEWSILPKELLKLTIVTLEAKKEFTYST